MVHWFQIDWAAITSYTVRRLIPALMDERVAASRPQTVLRSEQRGKVRPLDAFQLEFGERGRQPSIEVILVHDVIVEL